jgi:hypothetical protein
MVEISSLSAVRRAVVLLACFLVGATAGRSPLQAQVHTNCVSCPQVSITPDGGTASHAPNGVFTATFTAKNTGSGTGTWSFGCSGTGGISCALDDVIPAGATLAQGASVTLTATYTLGVAPGIVKVTATGTTNGETGAYTVTPTYGIAVTPDGTARTRLALSAGWTLSQ